MKWLCLLLLIACQEQTINEPCKISILGLWKHEFYPENVNPLTGEFLADVIYFSTDSFYWKHQIKIGCDYLQISDNGIYNLLNDSILLNSNTFLFSNSNDTIFINAIPYKHY